MTGKLLPKNFRPHNPVIPNNLTIDLNLMQVRQDAPWNVPSFVENQLVLDHTRTDLETARQENARLQSDLNSLRQAFAQMQSELTNLRPSPLIQHNQ